MPTRVWEAIAAMLPRIGGERLTGHRLRRLSSLFVAGTDATLFQDLQSIWDQRDRLVLGARGPASACRTEDLRASIVDYVDWMQLEDMLGYLPDDILVKVDRASMAVGLEARVPLLDRHVVELAWRMPYDLKFRNGRSKWLLRQVLHRYVPSDLVDRRKTGFGVPKARWLRGPLREYAEDLLDAGRMRAVGILDADVVQRCWRQHLSGERDWQARLWAVLMFVGWHRRWMH
jgi:asparagine synthase (glutamine-hydrolysing)